MLRTPAPFIGALGVCQKRALALLARRASEFWKTFCSLFSRFLKGCRLGSAIVRARVFALPSSSTRALLAPRPMAVPRSVFVLAGLFLGPVKRVALVTLARQMPWSPTCCFQDVRVCLAQCLNQSFARAPANRRAGRAIDALSTRALPKPSRSITKLNAVIEVSPWHRVDRRAADIRLTSQWYGRLRAAHSGAVHRRVRRLSKESTRFACSTCI